MWSFNAVAVLAQRGPRVVPCLDTMVINAKAVIVGRVVEAVPYRAGSKTNVVIAVEKRLKGSVGERVDVLVRASESTLDLWKMQGHRLLIAVPKGGLVIADGVSEGYESAFDLSAPDLAVLRADMTVLQDADSVVGAAEEAIRSHVGVIEIGTFTRTIPIVPSRMLRLDHSSCELDETWSIFCLVTLVPVDAALQRWAVDATQSTHVWERAEAAAALGHFPSDVNVALLKELLEDKGLHPTADGPSYWVRQRAYEALRSLGVHVPEPALHP